MRILLFILVVLTAAVCIEKPAVAQNYPWCAQYGGKMGGGENCGFSTYQQCMAALSGNGGFCNRNTQYVGGGGNGPSYRRHRRHHPND